MIVYGLDELEKLSKDKNKKYKYLQNTNIKQFINGIDLSDLYDKYIDGLFELEKTFFERIDE